MVRKVITHILYPVLIAGIVLGLFGVAQVFAGSNVDSTDKYARGTNVGWINFAPTHGGATVYSDHLEGYAWAENIGWIRLGTNTCGGTLTYTNTTATNYGVNRSGSNLSGYAWGTNVGWINFADANGGVTIDANGSFDGYAWGENIGWIHFKNTTPAYNVVASGITVDTNADELNSDCDCSLREAIQAANTNANVDACPAGSSADTINLPANTYTLSLTGASESANATGDLDVLQDLTIDGAGASSTIIQAGTTTSNGIDRVLHIDPAYSGNVAVTLNDLTIQNGKLQNWESFGAGILNRDTLTLNSSVVKNNQTDSAAGYGAGAGISTDNNLTLNNSTVSGNTAHDGQGGGIFINGGSVTLNKSTVSGNTAPDTSDSDSGDGGGIFNADTLTLNNSTVSGNTAANHGGGIYNTAGTLQLNYSTVVSNTADSNSSNSGNGGGLYRDGGTVNIKSSIVANNTLGGSGSGPDCNGNITSQDYNLIEATTACTITGVTTHNVTGSDPKLGPLGDYGGDTQTHALSPGSPAIDQMAGGTNNCGTSPFNADQRGETRPVDYTNSGTAKCDMGAFELQSEEVETVSNPGNGVTYCLSSVGTCFKFNSGAGGGGGGSGPRLMATITGVSVTKKNHPPGGGTAGEGEVSAVWEISVSGTGSYNAELTLCYTAGELGGSVVESRLELYRWSGSAWVKMGRTGAVDTVNKCVALDSITELSDWTLGDPDAGGPTGVTVRSFSARSNPKGLGDPLGFAPLALLALGAVGLLVLRWKRR